MTAPAGVRPTEPPKQLGFWIAIVDDDGSLRVALARALRSHGLSAVTYPSAEEFLERDEGQPDCLVLDIHLPGRNGFELFDQLRESSPDLPVIFITAHDGCLSENPRVRAAAGYLRKPFDAHQLVDLVRQHSKSERAK